MRSFLKIRALLSGGVLLMAATAGLAAEISVDEVSPPVFMRNSGQFRADVAFVARLRTSQIFVLNDGRVLHALPIAPESTDSVSARVVVESMRGSAAKPIGAEVAASRVTWLQTAATSASHEEAYEALEWRSAWPGIDMRLQIADGRTERVFRVAPGADPRRIALAYDGVRFQPDPDGRLVASSGAGGISLSAPIAFQETAEGRVAVDVRYAINEEGTRVTFVVGAYDRRLPLTIDPVLQSTYFGFGGASAISSVAVDPATGDLIIAGQSSGLGVPGAAGGFQSVHVNLKLFVARVDSKLRRVVQSTYFGGGGPGGVEKVAVHPQSGDIYVAGFVENTYMHGTGGGAQPINSLTRSDGFVMRFSPDLRQLLNSTYTNQSRNRVNARGMVINATTGDVYVAGDGDLAGYLLRFNRQLTTRLSRVTLEGNYWTRAFSVDINQATGDVYVAGTTQSTVLPQIAGAAQPSNNGEEGLDVFVARFNADLSEHLQSTFLSDAQPGSQPVVSRMSPMLLVNPASGEVYVAGWTTLTVDATGGAQPNACGATDIVVTRLSPDLRQRRGATYFCGYSSEVLGAMAFSPDGSRLYIAGDTFSNDLPGTAGGVQPTTPFTESSPSGFIASFSASLATLHQATYFVTDAHFLGMALTVHPVSGEVYFGGQCVDGLVETTGGLQPEYLGGFTSFGTGCLSRFDDALSGTPDGEPDPFTFTDQFATPLNADVTSAPVRIEGITAPAMAIVTNGTFSIDDGAFDSTPRDVRRGQTIRVRHTAASAAGISTDSLLTIGTRSDTFTSVTASGSDAAPAAFSFAPKSPVSMDIDVESAPIFISSVDAPAAISITNGEYSTDGQAFTTSPGVIHGGQSVVVRHRSASAPGTSRDTSLTIGGVNATFRSTTDPVDSSVHPFRFEDIDNVTPDFDAQAGILVMGINVPVPVSVSGAEWSTDGVNWSSASGTVTNLTLISLRKRSGSAGVTVSATLTVGDQSDEWTLRQPQAGDTTPDPFTFTPVNNAPLLTIVESNDITVTGVNVPVWASVTNGEFFDPVAGEYVTSGYLSNGATTRLRFGTYRAAGSTGTMRMRIGTGEATFQVRTTGGDPTPDIFQFQDVTGVATGSQVTSDPITLAGIIGDSTASVSGCLMSVSGGPFESSTVPVGNGSEIRLRLTASSTPGTTATCTVNVGGIADEFRVTTAGTAGGGGGSGKKGGGSWDLLSLALLGPMLLLSHHSIRRRRNAVRQ